MRVLLDENLPRKLKREFVGHEVVTVQERGWAGIRNGALLELAMSNGFPVLLTADRNLPHQQNIPALRIAVVVLAIIDTKIESIRPLVPELLSILSEGVPFGTVIVVGGPRFQATIR